MKYTIEEINDFINDIAIECASVESCSECSFLVKNNDTNEYRCTFLPTPWCWQPINKNI